MGSLTLRNIDDSLKKNLRMRAAANDRSMEEEARQILRQSLLRKKSSVGIGTQISQRFTAAGGIDLPEAVRTVPRRPPAFLEDDAP